MTARLTRREALALLAGTAASASLPGPALAEPIGGAGCYLQRGSLARLGSRLTSFASISSDLITTTGDPGLDKALGRALVRMSKTFGEQPGFGFIDDSDGMNAYATPDTQVTGTWGTVMFGREMFRDLMARNADEGMSVIAVAAHEFAHVAQFRSGLHDRMLAGQPTVRRIELHADYLAGYFLGFRKRENPAISVWASGKTLYEIGDYSFNDRNHHGTPAQRVEAAETGFALGKDGVAYADAFTRGAEYVLSRY